MPTATRRQAERRTELADEAAPERPWRVVLFNCECHTFDEVEDVVMKAVRCTLSRARQISHEVDTRGSAEIYTGAKERCEAVAEVVGSIGLRVEVTR